MFYEIKLKVDKENDKGEMKEVIERFITDVELFAEAEAKGLEQYNGNCDVFSITRSNVVEIVNEKEEDKPFYKATLIDIFMTTAMKRKRSTTTSFAPKTSPKPTASCKNT